MKATIIAIGKCKKNSPEAQIIEDVTPYSPNDNTETPEEINDSPEEMDESKDFEEAESEDEEIEVTVEDTPEDEDEEIDTSNCWYIAPSSDKDHPAVFPEELCRKILKYYSFAGDVVLDQFAGSGTFGRVALKMKRIPIMCEINEEYTKVIQERDKGVYDILK